MINTDIGSRQSGRTMRAMRAAPKNAVYVWPNGMLDYPKALAAYIGRDDLHIVSCEMVIHSHVFTGTTLVPVLDHAAGEALHASDYRKLVEIYEIQLARSQRTLESRTIKK